MAIIALLGVAHVTNRRMKLRTTAAFAAFAVATFLYCRHPKPLPIVGVQEFVFSLALGPVAMGSTAMILVRTVPSGVVMYSLVVMCFALAFQVLQSTVDVPFARRLGIRSSSLACALGYERSFQAFILCVTAAYGLLLMAGVSLGHLPNLLLVLSMTTVRDISDAFREEKVKDLPDRLAVLGAQLSAALIVSISVSDLLLQ